MLAGRRPADEVLQSDDSSPRSLLRGALYAPVLMMFWFAPPLAAWHCAGAGEGAVLQLLRLPDELARVSRLRRGRPRWSRWSCRSRCCSVLMLLSLKVGARCRWCSRCCCVLLPTLFASFYASYRDVFGVEPAMSRVREIPYNYTSFSDREIVLRLLGRGGVAAGERAARRAPHRPLRAHALRGAGRDLGDPAQPLPPGRAPRAGPSAAHEALGGHAPPPRRDRGAARRQPCKVARLLELTRDAVDRFEDEFAADARAARAGAAPPRARHAPRQHPVRRLRARLARHRRHRLARRDALRGGHARHRGGDARHREGADRRSASPSSRAAAARAIPAARSRSTAARR